MTVVWFLVAISILVAVHEFGHFYVARRCGVKVLRFSIGFGPRILRVSDQRGTEYALSAIPLGGYVKMLDEREGPVAEEELHESYNRKTVWQRIAIAAAGPLANIVLAFLLYWAIFLNGTMGLAPIIGDIQNDSLAEHAGLATGQEIISIDGQVTPTRRDVALALINRLGETGEIRIVARYANDGLSYESPVSITNWMRGVEEPDPLKGLGIRFYYPPVDKVIGGVVGDSPAARAGFEVGDELLEVNGFQVNSWQHWVEFIQQHPEQAMIVRVLRNNNEVELELYPDTVTNDKGLREGRAGVYGRLSKMPEEMKRERQFNVFTAMTEASNETKKTVGFVFLSLKKLILSEISIKNLSGPIGIAKVAADQARYGFWAFMSFLAHVSVVLAVLNILPIPVLDGGHILFCLVEWVKGSPLSEKSQLLGVKMGMAVLLCVMVVAFYNDILRL